MRDVLLFMFCGGIAWNFTSCIFGLFDGTPWIEDRSDSDEDI